MASPITADVLFQTNMSSINADEFLGSLDKTFADADAKVKKVMDKHVSRYNDALGDIEHRTGLFKKMATEVYGWLSSALDRVVHNMEDWRSATYQSIGGMERMSGMMNVLQSETGLAYDKLRGMTTELFESGFAASASREEIARATDISARFAFVTDTSASSLGILRARFESMGSSAEDYEQFLGNALVIQKEFQMTGGQLDKIMSSAASSFVKVQKAFGREAALDYGDALLEMGAAAKRAGLDVDVATGLMGDLTNNAMKYIVAIGGDALYKTPKQAMDAMVDHIDDIEAHVSSFPPALRNKLREEIYGLTAEQATMLQEVKQTQNEVEEAMSGNIDAVTRISTALGIARKGLISMEKAAKAAWEGLLQRIVQPIANVAVRVSKDLSALTSSLVSDFGRIFGGDGQDLIKQFATTLESVGIRAWEKMYEFITLITDSLVEWMESPAFQEWLIDIQMFIKDAYEQWSEFIDGVIKFVQSDEFGAWLNDAWDTATSVFNFIIDSVQFLGRTLSGVASIFYKIGGVVWDFVYPVIDALGSIISDIWSILSDLLSIFGPIVKVAFTPMVAAFRISLFVLTKIVSAFTVLIRAALIPTKVALQTSLFVLGTIWDTVVAIGKAIINRIVSAFKIASLTVHALRKAIEYISGLVSGVWERMKEGVSQAGEYIKNVFSHAWDFWSGLASGAWGYVKEGVSQAGEYVKNVFSHAWDFWSGLASGAWGYVKEGASQTGEYVKNVFSHAWDFWSGLASGAWSSIVDVVQKFGHFINNIFHFVWDFFAELAGKAVSNIVTSAGDAMSGIFDVVGNAFDRIKNIADRFWNWFKDKGSWAWNALSSDADAALAKEESKGDDIAKKMSEAGKGLAYTMEDAQAKVKGRIESYQKQGISVEVIRSRVESAIRATQSWEEAKFKEQEGSSRKLFEAQKRQFTLQHKAYEQMLAKMDATDNAAKESANAAKLQVDLTKASQKAQEQVSNSTQGALQRQSEISEEHKKHAAKLKEFANETLDVQVQSQIGQAASSIKEHADKSAETETQTANIIEKKEESINATAKRTDENLGESIIRQESNGVEVLTSSLEGVGSSINNSVINNLVPLLQQMADVLGLHLPDINDKLERGPESNRLNMFS